MNIIQVIKASGKKEEFQRKKIEESMIKAGASKELAKKIADKIEKQAKEGINTEKILDLALKFLKEEPEVAARYDLKRAIMMLGPSGFPFEEFFSQILKNYGYKTRVGVKVKGKVIEQEIDIIAEKRLIHMVEAKYHNRVGKYTDTKVAMYTYARFLDINSNPKNKFDQAWLVTNTKCTLGAIRYAGGVKLRVIGWDYPKKNNLQELIMKKGLYPITIFKDIPNSVKERLFHSKVVLAKDLIGYEIDYLIEKTGLSKRILNKILDEARKISNKNK